MKISNLIVILMETYIFVSIVKDIFNSCVEIK